MAARTAGWSSPLSTSRAYSGSSMHRAATCESLIAIVIRSYRRDPPLGHKTPEPEEGYRRRDQLRSRGGLEGNRFERGEPDVERVDVTRRCRRRRRAVGIGERIGEGGARLWRRVH